MQSNLLPKASGPERSTSKGDSNYDSAWEGFASFLPFLIKHRGHADAYGDEGVAVVIGCIP